jgi:FtsZ-interacting cell division protein ZipA
MEFFGPREVLIVVIALVIVAMVLDGVRRVKRNRYENLQMSSRKLQRNGVESTHEPDEIDNAQFPLRWIKGCRYTR